MLAPKRKLLVYRLYRNPLVSLGIGSGILSFIAGLAIKRGCEILEFSVLKWNKPSIRFYKNLGAEEKNEWSYYRFSGRALKRLASSVGDLPGEPTHFNI